MKYDDSFVSKKQRIEELNLLAAELQGFATGLMIARGEKDEIYLITKSIGAVCECAELLEGEK